MNDVQKYADIRKILHQYAAPSTNHMFAQTSTKSCPPQDQLYTDSLHTFVFLPLSPKVLHFFAHMSLQVPEMTMAPHQISPQAQRQHYLLCWQKVPHRSYWLKEYAAQSCSSCWRETFHNMALQLAQQIFTCCLLVHEGRTQLDHSLEPALYYIQSIDDRIVACRKDRTRWIHLITRLTDFLNDVYPLAKNSKNPGRFAWI